MSAFRVADEAAFQALQKRLKGGGAAVKTVKANKYRSNKTTTRGVEFDSKKEAKRWEELQALEQGGKIADLRRQVRISCVVNLEHVLDYYADFSYFDKEKRAHIHEDAKGYRTEVYKLKKKLVRACTGIEILET